MLITFCWKAQDGIIFDAAVQLMKNVNIYFILGKTRKAGRKKLRKKEGMKERRKERRKEGMERIQRLTDLL